MINNENNQVVDRLDDCIMKNSLYWNLTSLCNLTCEFCGIGELNQDKSYIIKEVKYTEANLGSFIKAIDQLPGQWEVFIGGGEPFVFPNFNRIVADIVKMGHVISVATNFTLPAEKYIEFCEIAGDKIKLLLASYKPWAHSFDDFLRKAKTLNKQVKSANGRFSVGAVAIEKETPELYELGLQFQKEDIEFALQVERVNGNYREYSDEEEGMIRYFGRTYGLGDKKNFKGKICQAGIRYFVLTPRGDAYRCHSACAFPDKNGGYLGNVISGNFSQSMTPLACPYPVCNCVNAYNLKLIDL